ncbi:hypothetical protein AWB94_33270 [Mycolicibacterium canariasense]|nr:hypothetical protein AWB94_33270 [Mycolicibacterium canariasense]
MEQHPGVSYQAALRAVTAHTPTGDGSGGRPAQEPSLVGVCAVDLFEALGIEDIATHDFTEVWARNTATASLRVPYCYRLESGAMNAALEHLDLTDESLGGSGPHPVLQGRIESGATHAELEYLDLTDESLGGNGPHVAIEGRTGSGKSHFLSSLVLGLAATYAPDTVSFVLADGKGGSTFEGLDKLPHVVAAVSHLEHFPPRVQRLIDFIASEMDRRAQLIYTHSKCEDFVSYTERSMQRAGSEYPRLPHLFIVVDELHAAARSHPRLVSALGHLARTGRALGMHLVVGDQPSDRRLGDELSEQLRTRITLPLDEPLHRIHAETGGTGQPNSMLTQISSRLSALSDFRAMDQYPLSDEAAQRGRIGFVRAEIDSLIGQDEVKEQLHGILTDASATAERVRRGLRVSPVRPNFVFTGAPGTGKTHAAEILADTLHAAGVTETSKVVFAYRNTLVGRFEGETSSRTSAVFDSARGGVLFVDSAYELVQDRGGSGDPFGREAVDTLSQRMRDGGNDPVVVLCGYPEEMRRFLAREQSLAGLFSRHVTFTSPSPAELWKHLVKFAEDGGHVLSNSTEGAFQHIVEELGKDNGYGVRHIDRLGNIRFARGVVDAAAGIAAQRFGQVADLSELTDSELFTLTRDDIVCAAERIVGSAGVAVE